MSKDNITVRGDVERKQRLYRSMRRLDVVMQIREKMAVKKIKSNDIAMRIGVSEPAISRWLKGGQNLQLDTLYLLADAIEEPLTLQIGRVEPSTVTQTNFTDSSGDEWRLSDATTWGNVVDMKAYQKMRQRFGTRHPAHSDPGLEQYLDGECDEYAEASA